MRTRDLRRDTAAFAPLLRDQGNSALDVAEVERAVVREILLAYDTDHRLQKEGLSGPFTLKEWIVEAGPAYFEATGCRREGNRRCSGALRLRLRPTLSLPSRETSIHSTRCCSARFRTLIAR